MRCEEITDCTFQLILLWQCSPDDTRCVMRLVSLHGKSAIPNSSCFVGKPESQQPEQSRQYSSSAKGCTIEKSYFGFR